jgi:hypothetical protein
MKNKLFMYLFLFAALFIIYQYMNEKKIFENQESQIETLRSKMNKAEDSLASMEEVMLDLNYFTLQGNENAMTYLENNQLDAAKVEQQITDYIYDQNVMPNGNPLIPFDGMEGIMRINKIKFLNHKWIVADFSDGTYWGELLIEYYYDDKNELHLERLGSLLYPN